MGNKPNMTAAEARAKYLAEQVKRDTKSANTGKRQNMTASEARAKYLAENNGGSTTVTDSQKAIDWLEKYNSTVKGVSDYDTNRNGRYTGDVSGGFGSDIDNLIGEYERFQNIFDGYELNEAYQNLKELQNQINIGNEYMKSFGNAKSYYDSQVQARELDAQRKEVEVHRTITRDAATIQKELDAVNSQLQDHYKQLNTKNVLDTLGAVASNVMASSSGFAAQMPHTISTTPEIEILEQRKKELEEEQSWAQYFVDEKHQQDTASWAQKYAGKTFGELQYILDYGGLYGTDEHKWLQEYAPGTMTADDKRKAIAENETEISVLEAVLKEYEGLAVRTTSADDYSAKRRKEIYQQYGSEKELEARIEELKAANWQMGNEIAYGELDQNADFAEKSGYASTAGKGSWWEKFNDPTAPNYGDLEYEYINGRKDVVAKVQAHNTATHTNIDHSMDQYEKYDYMTEDEVANYNYLYATEGKETAKRYLEYITYRLNERRMDVFAQETAEGSSGFWKGLGSSLASVPMNLMGGAGIVDVAFQNLGNKLEEAVTGQYAGPVDYNREAMKFSVGSSTIRNTVSGNIAKATGTINLDPNQHPTLSRLLNGKSLGDVYQLGMSMADSAAIVAMAPVLGGAGTVLLGGSAGTQGMLDAVANGATDEQALTMGVLNGAFEMIFEKVSLDKLLQGGSKNVIHAILTQGAVEGSEETFTSIANTVADIVVMAEKSGWEQGIAAYMAQGMTREEAEKEAFLDVAVQIGWDFAGGMISGGIMGGAEYGIDNRNSKLADSQAPVNPVAAPQQEETAQQPMMDIDPDSPQGQIIRNMTGEQNAQTQQPVVDIDPDSPQGQIIRNMTGEEPAAVGTSEQQEQLKRLSDITGREVVMYRGKAYENGYFDRSTGKIYVNVNGVDPVVQTFSHELTHSTEGAKVYNELKTWVFDKLSQSGNDLARMKAEKIRQYEQRGKQLDSIGAEQEIVADYIAKNLLTNEQVITDVCRSKPSLGRQILNWIDRFFAKLNITSKDRAALERAKILYAKALNQTQGSFNGQTAEAAPARNNNRETTNDHTDDWKNLLDFREKIHNAFEAGEITEEEYDQYQEIADQWEQELQGKTGADVQHSIAQLPDGKKYVRADRQVIFGNDPNSWSEQVEDYINGRIRRGQDVSLIAEDGGAFTITTDTAGKMSSQYANDGTSLDEEVFVVKANAAVHIDELIEISTPLNTTPSPDYQNRHPELARNGWLYRTAFFHDFDGKHYKLTLSVASGDYGNVPYNIGKIERRSFPNVSGPSTKGGAENGKASSKETVPQEGVDVKQYSVSGAATKQDVVSGLKDILRRGGDINELRRYVSQVEQTAPRAKQNAPRADQNTREAERILRSAKQQGISVEEYLSQNWELYETENGWDPAARKALEMEKADTRQYSLGFTKSELSGIQNNGRISVNSFSAKEIKATEKLAQRYWKEMGEKSPFFRAWFGDWRVADTTPIQVADQQGDTRGTQHNEDTGWDIQVSGKVFAESKHYAKKNTTAIPYLPYINDIVRKAVLLDSFGIDSKKMKSTNSLLMHNLYAVADIGYGPEVLKLYVEEINNPNAPSTIKRAYQLQNIEKASAVNGGVQGNANSSLANTTNAINTVADLFAAVKQMDTNFQPNPVSKVVNSDGTPQIVYHGTNKKFNVFNSQSGLYWFSKYEDYAESMMEERGGGEVKAAYLNMRNPYRAKLQPGQFSDPAYEAEIIRKAKAGNHDGIIIENDTTDSLVEETFYVVFEPEQIKSATENIGTYDKDNPDIRYSISDTQAETEDQQESLDTPTAREQLPKKAQNYLKRVERELLKNLAGMMNAHHFTDRSYLQDIIRALSDEYLRTGTVSQETKDNLFTQAYTRGVVVDAEFYEQFKEVKTYLRTVSVTLSQKDTSNIADWFDFRQRAFGTLRIVNEGGLPVDTAYDELREMAPALFPEGITHPADQLVHMYEVAKSITKSEKTLKDYHHADAQTFRKLVKADFESAIGAVIRELRTVKRVADEKAAKDAEEAKKVPVTSEEAMTAYTELKQARRNYEKVTSKNLLTDQDEMQVGRLLKGEILPKHLDKDTDNVEGILAVFEAKKDYERLCGVIAEYKRNRKGELRKLADSYLQNAGQWVDKRKGILYSRETMRRNIQDIVKDEKEAAAINAEFFDPIQVAEAAATRFKTEYRDRVRALGLSTKARRGDMVSEAHAVQLLGEVQDNIRALENARGRIRQKDGKTLAEWRAVIDEMWQSSPSLDREKIEGAVREFRYIYDDLFRQMNEARVRNGYEPVNYRKGYFPHFQPGGDGIITQFGKALGISTEVNALPTTINGLTHTFKPGIQWFGNAQERLGFNTAYDAVEGFDKYIEGVASVIHQTDNIQKLRALASQVRYRTTDEGIRQQVDEVLAKDTLTEEEKQARINEIYEHGRFTLSNFVVELDEYTNLLANKKSKLDRTMEGFLGRRAYTVMKNIESRVGANMIAGNLSSALTNFIPLTQASAQLDRFSLLRGMWSALQSYRQDDGIVGMSTFLTNRRGSDPLIRNWTEKVSGVLSKPMELIDNFVSDSIVRAAYFQNLKHGLSDAEAMHQADIFAAGVMADRSKGSMPTLFESRNPILKAFTQFQLEVNNQFSEVFKDLPRNHAEKGTAMLALVFLKYFLGAFIFDDVYEYFIGRRPALDPIDVLNSTVGDLTGYELPNLLELGEGLITGEMPSFETEKVGLGTAGINLVKSAAEDLPFSSIVTDGGRIPVSSAIPDFKSLWNAATDTEMNGKKRWKEAQTELNKLAYILPPFGGNQISKIWKGVKAYTDGGSYSVNNEGEDILQYPVYKDDPEDAFWNLVRSALMGKSSLPEAQEWVEGGFDSLNAKQTAIYQDLLDAGVKDREAYSVIRDMESVAKTDTTSKEAEQRQFLRNSDLMDDGKAILYYGLLASDKDQNLMDNVTDSGADPWIAANLLMDLQDAENAAKKRELIAKASLTQEEKVEIYREKVSDANDADIAALRVAGIGFNEYLKIYQKSADTNSLEFSYWVDSQGYSDKQAEAIKDCFESDSKYEKYVDKGLDPDMAYELMNEFDDLEPPEGKTSVQQIQRWRLCVDFTDNTEDQMTALYAVMQPTQYQKVEMAHDFGVKPREYVSFKETLPNYDSDGNGYYKQAEITAAIDSLNCSVDVKAVLWQLAVGKSTKGKSNPYSRKIGQQVYEARQAAPKVSDEEESTLADDFSAEIARQWMGG